MFIYNVKINGGIALKLIIILLSVFMLIVFGISIYRIFFSNGQFEVNDRIMKNDITEIDVNGISGRMQDADISYIGILLKGRVLIWKAGTRVYLGQLIGVEDGFSEAEPVLQGMLDTFETAADYRSRTGAV